MTIRKVLCYPDPRLRTKAKPVTNFTGELQRLIADMFETLYEHNAVGLAATQIDIHEQLIVIDASNTRDQPLVIINPEILEHHETIEFTEGCVSFPGIYEKVNRSNRIKFRAQDGEGHVYEMFAEGLLSECVQHEMDHLQGKLLVDYLSPLKRDRILKKMQKAQKRNL